MTGDLVWVAVFGFGCGLCAGCAVAWMLMILEEDKGHGEWRSAARRVWKRMRS